MDTSASTDDSPVQPALPVRKRRRWPWIVGSVALVLCLLYGLSWSSQPLALQDGRRFEVLNFNRHVSIALGRDGSRSVEHLFWVRYWSNAGAPEDMQQEARSLAPVLFPIADSLGYSVVRLEPARPLLFRRFPVLVYSTTLRFERDSSQGWREIRASSHGA